MARMVNQSRAPAAPGPLGPGSRVPSFFLVGAFKAGTTALYQYLGQHPEVYLSPRKEPAYFASEFRVERLNPEWRRLTEADAPALAAYLEQPHRAPNQPRGPVTRWGDYLKLFRDAKPGQAIGEGSVAYIWSRTAAAAIRARIPDARILMILRDPRERAFSQYHTPRAPQRESFGDAIRRSADSPSALLGPLDPLLEFGNYAGQVQRYLDHFPRDRVRVHLYEDFVRNREGIVRDVFGFLGLPPDVPLDLSKRHNVTLVPRFPRFEVALRHPVGAVRRWIPSRLRRAADPFRWRSRASLRMSEEDRRFLTDHYADDVRRLEGILDRDLSAWLR